MLLLLGSWGLCLFCVGKAKVLLVPVELVAQCYRTSRPSRHDVVCFVRETSLLLYKWCYHAACVFEIVCIFMITCSVEARIMRAWHLLVAVTGHRYAHGYKHATGGPFLFHQLSILS
jgi:hypothetical protein